ncbi:hypothetical protein KKG36_01800 [Patescibacteria group bacterium]|nr:hypothetical protein [Patescibacteria group bacterium]
MNQFWETLKSLWDFVVSILTSEDIQTQLFPAKVVFIVAMVLFLAGIFYFMFFSSFIKHRFLIDWSGFWDNEPPGLKKIIRRWAKITKRYSTGTEYDLKLAVLEAENLLDEVLMNKGFTGLNFEERVKQVPQTQLPNAEGVLESHKLRDAIAHDPNYKPSRGEVKKALDAYEVGIKAIESF